MGCNLQQLIRHMLESSGMSAAEVSRTMGKTNGYLSVMLHNGTVPGIDLFVTIADACGYSVELHENRDFEKWDLYTENGSIVAMKDYGEEDMPELERERMKAFERLKAWGRNELIDELVEYLQGLKEE